MTKQNPTESLIKWVRVYTVPSFAFIGFTVMLLLFFSRMQNRPQPATDDSPSLLFQLVFNLGIGVVVGVIAGCLAGYIVKELILKYLLTKQAKSGQ